MKSEFEGFVRGGGMNNPDMTSSHRSYLLLFRDPSPDTYRNLSQEERQRLLERWNEWYAGLKRCGKVQHGHPLEPEGRVVSHLGGRVVDGPYVESKEAVGGYFYVVAADLDEAVLIARQCPGLQHGISVEVRPVAETCAVLRESIDSGAAIGAGPN